MSEILKPVPPPNAGTKPPAAVDASVVFKPSVRPVGVAAAAGSAPALFGGHRGGGKKRADGLVAGSPEAVEADKKKDRDRKNLANAAKRSAPLPPPLPYSANAFPDPTATLDSNSNAVPVPVAGAPIVAAPLFVLWSQKLLEKPARLLTKIADRIRCWSLMKRVRKLGLTPDQEKEIAADLKWKDEVTADFNAALAECATVELNKHRVSGSQNAHWFNLAMSGGEMAMVHMQTLERLEKMVAVNETDKAEAKTAAKN